MFLNLTISNFKQWLPSKKSIYGFLKNLLSRDTLMSSFFSKKVVLGNKDNYGILTLITNFLKIFFSL